MAYKHSRRHQIIGDISGSDDSNRNTGINFEEDYIGLRTNGATRFKISGSSGAITFNEAFTFPTSDGNDKQVLSTNGNGVVSWVDQSSGGSGGGGLEYATGHVDLTTNNKPVNWVNASSISAASGIKSWFIVPKATTIDKVIVSVKGNNFNTANDGNVTLSIYKNQQNYGSTIVNQTVGADTFTEKVSNFSDGTTDCNQKIFSNLNQSVAEGDVIHIKVGKSAGSDKEAIVTMVFDSGGGSSSPEIVVTGSSNLSLDSTYNGGTVIITPLSADVTHTLPDPVPDFKVKFLAGSNLVGGDVIFKTKQSSQKIFGLIHRISFEGDSDTGYDLTPQSYNGAGQAQFAGGGSEQHRNTITVENALQGTDIDFYSDGVYWYVRGSVVAAQATSAAASVITFSSGSY
jgi:hypothetical protein